MRSINQYKSFFIAFVVLCFFSLSVSASDDYRQKLWSVSRDGEIKGYLLGTVHLVRRGIWRGVGGLEDVFPDKIKRLVVEMQEEDLSDPTILIESRSRNFGSLTDEGLRRNISEVLGEQIFDDFSLLALSAGLPHLLIRRGGDGEVIFEFQLAREAGRLGKPVHSLDTLKRLRELGESISVADYEKMLRSLVENIVQKKITARSIERDYWSGKLVRDYFENSETRGFRERFCAQRNLDWLPGIVEYLRGGDVLVAVGTTHLYGQSGLIKLLEDEGFVLEPVSQLADYSDFFSDLFSSMSSAVNDIGKATAFGFKWLLGKLVSGWAEDESGEL